MKIEKIDDEKIRVIYETELDIIFMERINQEKHQLKTVIKSLQREIKILKGEKHGFKQKQD